MEHIVSREGAIAKLHSLKRIDEAAFKTLNAFSHILSLGLALNVDINQRDVFLLASILLKELLLHLVIDKCVLPLLLLHDCL